jgi:hypothetical protein
MYSYLLERTEKLRNTFLFRTSWCRNNCWWIYINTIVVCNCLKISKEQLNIYTHNHFIPFEEIFGHDEDRSRRETLVMFNVLSSIISVLFNCDLDISCSNVIAGWRSFSFDIARLSKAQIFVW